MKTYFLLKKYVFRGVQTVAAGDADVVQTLWARSGTVAFGGSGASRGDEDDHFSLVNDELRQQWWGLSRTHRINNDTLSRWSDESIQLILNGQA